MPTYSTTNPEHWEMRNTNLHPAVMTSTAADRPSAAAKLDGVGHLATDTGELAFVVDEAWVNPLSDPLAVSVASYGAVGDGVVDDTAAIQAAMDAAPAVFFPDGTYRVTAPLVMTGRTTLFSQHIGSYAATARVNILCELDDYALYMDINQGDSSTTRGRNKVLGLHFYQGASNAAGGIYAQYATGTVIAYCGFRGLDLGGIKVNGYSYGVTIQHNQFNLCGDGGNYDITCDGPGAGGDYNTQIVIADNIIETSKTGAIYINRTNPSFIMRNYIEPASSLTAEPLVRCVSGSTSVFCNIADNYITATNGNPTGVSCDIAMSRITGNHISNFGTGISCKGDKAIIDGNTISDATSYGIFVGANSAGLNPRVVANNTVEGVGACIAGVYVANFASGVQVTGNAIKQPANQGVRLFAGDRCVVSDNTFSTSVGKTVYEDTRDTNVDNYVSHDAQAQGDVVRWAYKYDRHTADEEPTGSYWYAGQQVDNSDPLATGNLGWVCITAGEATDAAAWITGEAVVIDDERTNAGNLYRATTNGTTGATPPTHGTGTVSDGAVSWLYINPVAVFVSQSALPNKDTRNYPLFSNVAAYTSGTNPTTGAVVIDTQIPIETGTNILFTLRAVLHQYEDEATTDFRISGYSFGTGPTFPKANLLREGPITAAVQLGRNADGNVAIIIGTIGDTYAYPKCAVLDLSYSKVGDSTVSAEYGLNWTISQKTDLSDYDLLTAVTDTSANHQFVRSGAALPAAGATYHKTFFMVEGAAADDTLHFCIQLADDVTYAWKAVTLT